MKKTASLWLMNSSTCEFLIQLRSPKMSNNPNTWSNSAGGQLDDGETPLQTVTRETFEELGLDIPESDFVFLGDFHGITTKGKPKHLWIFFTKGDFDIETMKIEKSEVTAIRYAPLSEIKKIVGTFACSIQPEKIKLLEEYLIKSGHSK